MVDANQSRVSAPGCVVVLGEHAVDSGFAAVAVATGPRVICSAHLAPRFTVNGEDLDPARHPMVRAAVLHAWPDMDRPIAFTLEGGLPTRGGDAALIVACLGAMSMLQDHIIFANIARDAFLASGEDGGFASPLDTSAATHGRIVAVSTTEAGEPLWDITGGGRTWHVRDIGSEGIGLVLGLTGDGGRPDLQLKVARYCERNGFARDILRDLGAESEVGVAAFEDGDAGRMGEAMNRSQRLLANLGAVTPAQDRLLSAVARHCHGAKAAGYSGDAIICLARDADRAAAAIEAAGGTAVRLETEERGVSPED